MPVSSFFIPQVTKIEMPQKITISQKKEEKEVNGEREVRLTKEELALLEKFDNGEIGYNEMQKEVAKRAFIKILKYPDGIQIKDWLQSEMIKIKREESQVKMSYLETFVRKMFSGHLPTHCKNCGKPLFQEGEIIDDKSVKTERILPEA